MGRGVRELTVFRKISGNGDVAWRWKGIAGVALGWAIARTLMLCRALWSFTTDDAYITLRYSRHLAEGHGITWNAGAEVPVEGYSNFLFVLLGAAALKLQLDPVVILKALSCVALVGTEIVLYLLARRWLGPFAAALPALFLAGFNGSAFWAVSGLETTTFQFLVVSATYAFTEALSSTPATGTTRRQRVAGWACGLLCLAAALTRPEGPLLAIVLGSAALVHFACESRASARAGNLARRELLRAQLKHLIIALLFAFAVPYALYFGWRVAYFGRLLPNTVTCKAAYDGDPWTLLHDFWRDAKVFILLALVQRPGRLGALALPLFLLPLAYAVILIGADPIIGHFSRHFLAPLALLTVASAIGMRNLLLLATRAVAAIAKRIRLTLPDQREVQLELPERLFPRVADVAACVIAVAWTVTLVPGQEKQLVPLARSYAERMDARAALGRELDSMLTAEQTYAIGDAGMVPYKTRAKVIDVFGLNSRVMSSPEVHFDRTKFLSWLFNAAPEVIVVHSASATELQPRGEYGFYPALVDDERFKEDYVRYPRVFGAPGDDFHYWVFQRRESASREQP